MGVFNLLIVLVTNQYQFLAVGLGMGVLSGFGATAMALVGSVTPRERLGYALGLLGTGQVLGIVFGPLLGGVVDSYFGYRVAFLFTGALALAACGLTVVLVREGGGVQPTAYAMVGHLAPPGQRVRADLQRQRHGQLHRTAPQRLWPPASGSRPVFVYTGSWWVSTPSGWRPV